MLIQSEEMFWINLSLNILFCSFPPLPFSLLFEPAHQKTLLALWSKTFVFIAVLSVCTSRLGTQQTLYFSTWDILTSMWTNGGSLLCSFAYSICSYPPLSIVFWSQFFFFFWQSLAFDLFSSLWFGFSGARLTAVRCVNVFRFTLTYDSQTLLLLQSSLTSVYLE